MPAPQPYQRIPELDNGIELGSQSFKIGLGFVQLGGALGSTLGGEGGGRPNKGGGDNGGNKLHGGVDWCKSERVQQAT